MKTILVVVLLFIHFGVNAQPKGSISFSDKEKAEHAAGLAILLAETVTCLQEDLDHHQAFYNKYGISPFYGDQSSFAKLSHAQKKAHVKSLGLDPALVDQMQPTSCIGLTVKCMERGFIKADQKTLWDKLRAYVSVNDYQGTVLQSGLQALGWSVLYWNPKTANNQKWDAAEKAANPTNSDNFWGHHEYRWNTVQTKQMYYFNKVDDFVSLVDFGASPPQGFQAIPFYIGTAHTGYHVFPGSYGRVIEGHSTRLITDSQTVESSPFNPMATGGGPRGKYYSGLIAIPPGY